MRLWSIHPKYLDRQGLLACWREGLLAQKVLLGKTKGYKSHPQLERFKDNIHLIGEYLWHIFLEANKRKYKFDHNKISKYIFGHSHKNLISSISITTKQLEYEIKHLQEKLKSRDLGQFVANLYNVYDKNIKVKKIEPHPLFKVIKGDIETWEKIK